MITLADTQKSFDKIQSTFMIKILTKVRMEGYILNLVKNIYKNVQQTFHLKVEKLDALPLSSETRQ